MRPQKANVNTNFQSRELFVFINLLLCSIKKGRIILIPKIVTHTQRKQTEILTISGMKGNMSINVIMK